MDNTVNEIRLQKWAAIIREVNKSGMQKKLWCEQNGISTRQFYYWQKKVREHILSSAPVSALPAEQSHMQTAAANSNQAAGTPVFCQLEIPGLPDQQDQTSSTVPSFSPELLLQCGRYQILVGTGIRPTTLSTVLEVIRHA